MSIEDDLAGHPGPVREALVRLITLARAVAPDAVDGRSYGQPALLLDGRPLLGVGVAKAHLSLIPFSPAALDTVRARLSAFDVPKGMIRFTVDHQVPDDVVEDLVRARLTEIRG